MITVMWEAVADPDRIAEVVGWATGLAADGLAGTEVYVSADSRVVVLAHWRDEDSVADLVAPAGTLRREPHAWRFTRVG